MSKFPCLIIATAILAGCAVPPPIQSTLATRTYSPYSAPAETVSIPSLNVVSSVEVGQSIVSTAKRTVIQAIELEQDVVHSGKNLGNQFVLNIPKGKLIHRGFTEGGKFYQADKELNFVVGASTVKVRGGVFIPDDKALPTEIFWLAPSNNRPLNDAHPDIKYKATVIEQWGEDSFKRELVYSGVSQNTISILYREFQNDMARPAFSQELKYDLSQGKAIGYKGARFEVTKANNIGLEYKVLKTLD